MQEINILNKVVTATEARKLVTAIQSQGSKRVGAISGSFDVVTGRNFKVLNECKKYCDVLIVLLNSDKSIGTYKGVNRPIYNQKERSYILSNVSAVDHIVIFDELTPVEVLDKIRPNVFFNSLEWGTECIETHILKKYGGVLKLINVHESGWFKHSSEVINSIIRTNQNESKGAIFLDRDGVINENKEGYLYRWEDIVIKSHVVSALKAFAKAGYKLIIVTNQSGIARGRYTEKQVRALHKKMTAYFKEKGVTIDAIYFCPHGPTDGCLCRKPGIGMLTNAALEQNLNLSKSWFIGDRDTDIQAGRFANVKTVYLGSKADYPKAAYRPNYFASDMKAAQSCILPKK